MKSKINLPCIIESEKTELVLQLLSVIEKQGLLIDAQAEQIQQLKIAQGNINTQINITQDDEIRHLAQAVNQMGKSIVAKQAELNKQKKKYQNLFELVPCLITVQDKNFKLLRYNKEFKEKFAPRAGDFCYEVYKNRDKPCEKCPMQETFKDGKSHHSEQEGINKDGSPSFWTLRTAPITNHDGNIVAVMEISVDITQTRLLEKRVIKSEEKYRAIFNNIPNPVFVLDKESLKIFDCNDSVTEVYEYTKTEIINTSFTDLFMPEDRKAYAQEIKKSNVLDKTRQLTKSGKTLYVNIRVSPSEYSSKDVLLVTTSDITKRLMVEQQLIQASKMATLGEMGTGVAHELNQPLSVIKSASNFLMKKTRNKEPVSEKNMITMTEEIDSQVDRAAKIINHMREFGRKSDVTGEKVNVNIVLNRSFDFFSQQLKVREISVIKDFQEDIPFIMADPNRLEQIIINLLINARDAIEDRWEQAKETKIDLKKTEKRIYLKTWSENHKVYIEVKDNGKGIPQEIMDKIFEPFFTTKKVGKGTGLGLSISYGIIQDYEGTIKVVHGKEGGACFIIQFPINYLP